MQIPQEVLVVAGCTAAGLTGLAVVLTSAWRLGAAGRAVSEWCRFAPVLDVLVATFTWLPWVVGAEVAGWAGVAAALAGQTVALWAWILGHEAVSPRALAGPRIVRVNRRLIGRVRNQVALWMTLIVLPIFWAIRLAQILVWPVFALVTGFPRYRQSEWINVSRTKFEGLVGHDLVWCLYCDWMTGVYSLGAEMLRNVESFWCPIRFYDGKKCENCRTDFPDVDGGWVKADGTMAEVTARMDEMYSSGNHAWFGHPGRKSPASPDGEGGAAAAVIRLPLAGQAGTDPRIGS